MNKLQIFFVLILISLLGLAVLYSFNSRSKSQEQMGDGKQIKIGISQSTSHTVFDETKKGLIKGFANGGYKEGKNIIFDFQNAQGEASTNQAIAQKFAQSDYNLFIPLGTQASQALVNLVKEKPVVFGIVTDPLSAGLVTSKEHPGANITGTSDITLYKEQLELLKQLGPNVKRIGSVYNPSEANSLYGLEQTKKYCKELGFELVNAVANNSGEVLSASYSLADKVDAYYILPDNTAVSAQDAIVKVALEVKKPLVAFDQSGIEKGGLATYGTSYEKAGERTAEIAIRVLKGEKPGDIPVLGVTDADLFINLKTAKQLGITISQDLLNRAKQVYQ